MDPFYVDEIKLFLIDNDEHLDIDLYQREPIQGSINYNPEVNYENEDKDEDKTNETNETNEPNKYIKFEDSTLNKQGGTLTEDSINPIDNCYTLNNLELQYVLNKDAFTKDLDIIVVPRDKSIKEIGVIRALQYQIFHDKLRELKQTYRKNNNVSNIPKDEAKNMIKAANEYKLDEMEWKTRIHAANIKMNILSDMLNFEKQLLNKYYVLYHSSTVEAYILLIFHNILEKIYIVSNNKCIPFNSFNIRYFEEKQSDIVDVTDFKNKYPRNKHIWWNKSINEHNNEWNDNQPSVKKHIVSANLFLHGNLEYPGESTTAYYLTGQSHTNRDFFIDKIYDILCKKVIVEDEKISTKWRENKATQIFHNTKKKLQNIFKETREKYESNIVFQIIFPRDTDLFDKYTYISTPGGLYLNISPSTVYELLYKKKYKEISDLLYDELDTIIYKNPHLADDIKKIYYYNNLRLPPTPGIIARIQLRILITQELLESNFVLVNESIALNVKASLTYQLTNVIDSLVTSIKYLNAEIINKKKK